MNPWPLPWRSQTIKSTTIFVSLAVPLVLVVASAFAYERLQGPTELLYWNKEKAFNGYTLFGVGNRTFLLDMEGRVVHTWPIGTNPHLLDNGHILDASKDDPSGFQGFKELDWDGKMVWEYTEKREGYAPHHDWVRIFNKMLNAPTTVYIANKAITNEQALAAGADPKKGPYRGDGQMDAVVEVDMQGKVVWEWWFFDHVVQDVDPTKANYVGPGKTIADHPGRINLNLPGRPLKRDWLHCNSMDYNAESGQIVINSVQGELYVVDHDGTFVPDDPKASIAKAASPAGDFLYRFGDPARYGQGDPPRVLENWDAATSGHKQMGGAHDVHWIRPGLPGAGHIMVLNNGQYLYQRTPQSSVLEINPFLDAGGRDTGKYVNPPVAGYRRETYDHDTHNEPRQISKQIVWSYRSVNSHNFFSHIGCSGQRLPNGSTFICSDTEGHFFEVTGAGELVWEYINPVTRDGAVKVLNDVLPMTNSAFRAYRYAADHPAFQGRDLTPQGTITERAAQGLDVRPKRRPPPGKGDGQERAGKGGKSDGGERRGDQMRPDDERPSRDGQSGGSPQGGRRRGFGRSLLARALDADGDGVLSTAEMENAAVALKTLDKNGDGKLTADEIDDASDNVAPDGRKRRPGGPLMRLLDTDRNGELSAEEIRNAPAVLKAANKKNDGTLTPEEVDATSGGGGGPGGGERGGRRGGQNRPDKPNQPGEREQPSSGATP